jgi:hypothetical protein
MKRERPALSSALWVLAGAVILLTLTVLVLHFRPQSAAARLEEKDRLLGMVADMRLHLGSSIDAEQSAVMATTDEDSRAFADRTRSESADVEKLNAEIGPLLRTDQEKALQAQFAAAFADLKRIDAELLELAVKNSNVKATALAFGPCARTVQDIDAALRRIARRHPGDPRVSMLVLEADTGVLRIQARIPSHIAEESDPAMDSMEALMRADEKGAREAASELSAMLPKDADMQTVNDRIEVFFDLERRIIELSRANTNVKSLALSLTVKRKAAALCQDALSALQEAVQSEEVPGAVQERPR